MENALVTLAKKLHQLLFDFSASENNRREVEDILTATLAEAQNDDDFLPVLRRVILAYEGDAVEGKDRWLHFRRFMARHRRRSDFHAGIRTRAEHLLEDLPRIYGFGKKRKASVPLQAPAVPTRPSSRVAAAAATSETNSLHTKEKNADV